MSPLAQTALVTGASSGIGEQFALQMAARGLNLVLAARSEDRLQALATRLRSQHPGIEVGVIVSDLAVPEGPKALTDRLAGDGTVVDVLVNNAGFGSHNLFVDEDPDNLAREIQLNCSSLVTLTSRLLPGMVERGRGGVLNVASTAGFQPIPTMAVYAATKAFVLSFTEALWAETRKTGVRVVALCPGATETEFFDATGKDFMTSGRQSADEVAAVGLKAFFDGNGPTVVSGTLNRLMASSSRLAPRSVVTRIAELRVRPSR
ncbi:MAG: SDR family oxidoreductase [Mycobacteriaceae bacterium]